MRFSRRVLFSIGLLISIVPGSAEARWYRHYGYGFGRFHTVKFSWEGVAIAAGMIAAIVLAALAEDRRQASRGSRPRQPKRVRSIAPGASRVNAQTRLTPGVLGRWHFWMPIASAFTAAAVAYLVMSGNLPFRVPFLEPVPAAAATLSVCSGGDRAGRKLTCIVDGDTGWEHGVKWRYEAIDAPEMPEHASCPTEARKAIQARDRLRELMGQGYRINWSGRSGIYHRALVTITLSDGRDAGEVLLKEGLAQPWPNHSNPWCR